MTSVQLWQPEEFPLSKNWHLGSCVHCGVSVSWEAEGSLRSLQFWRAVSSVSLEHLQSSRLVCFGREHFS